MLGLPLIDVAVIGLYFLSMIGIGFWTMSRIHNQEDYFLGGRRFGKIIQTFAAFGQATSAESGVTLTTTTYRNGAAGIWSGLCILFATPVYWMTAPWYRRLRLLTMGDFFEERYQSKSIAAIYALIASIGMMGIISIGIGAMSVTVVALTPKDASEMTAAEVAEVQMAQELSILESRDFSTMSQGERARLSELRRLSPRGVISHVSRDLLIIIVCIVVLIYGIAGGLHAAFITDTIQGIFLIILSVLLIPFIWGKVNTLYGGDSVMDAFRTLHHYLPESFFEIMGSPKTLDFTWYYISALAVMVTVNVMVQPNQLVAIGAAKDEYTARFGFTAGIYMKRAATVMWGLFALFAVLVYSDTVRDSDMVWGYATLDLLGPLNMGLVGLMIACLMAALMSTADCLMITASSLLTHNFYRLVVRGRPEKHYVLTGRLLGAVVVIGGAVIATMFESIFAQIKFLWEFYAIFAASFWLGMLWRRATRAAAWSSILFSLFAFFLLPLLLPLFVPGLRSNEYLTRMTQPRVIQREYNAREMDVQNRMDDIQRWEALPPEKQAQKERPEPLKLGEAFTKTYQVEARSIFWTQGIKTDDEGVRRGRGMLNLGLLTLYWLGWDLTTNPFALNETLRILLRTILPFLIIFIASFMTRHRDERALDRFYAKMRTPVQTDREADRLELEKALSHPESTLHMKMFPHSQWEIRKWNKVDVLGFLISVAVAFGIIGLLFLVVSIGG